MGLAFQTENKWVLVSCAVQLTPPTLFTWQGRAEGRQRSWLFHVPPGLFTTPSATSRVQESQDFAQSSSVGSGVVSAAGAGEAGCWGLRDWGSPGAEGRGLFSFFIQFTDFFQCGSP